MKSLKKVFIIGLFAIGFALLGKPANAAPGSKYYVALTTVPVNASVAEYSSQYPNITGALFVRKIIFSNSAPATAQTLSVYDTCTSTTAAALKFQTYLGTTSMVTQAVQSFDFLPQSFKLTTPCFKKSSTSSTVDMTVFYE